MGKLHILFLKFSREIFWIERHSYELIVKSSPGTICCDQCLATHCVHVLFAQHTHARYLQRDNNAVSWLPIV